MKLTKDDIVYMDVIVNIGNGKKPDEVVLLSRLREVVEELKDYTTPSEVCDCDVVDSIWASKIIRLFGEVLE